MEDYMARIERDYEERREDWSVFLTVCAIVFVACVTFMGCAKPFVTHSGQIMDASGNPLYPALSQPELIMTPDKEYQTTSK
jgi:hypothetical protein